MARQIGYEPLETLLPVRILDGYGRERPPVDLDTIVIENDRLRATVLPGLGGRVHSLFHKPTGRELLYRQPGVPARRLRAERRVVLRRHRVEHRRHRPHHPLLRPPARRPRARARRRARWCACGSGSGCATSPSRSTSGSPTTPTSCTWASASATRTSGPRPSTGGPTSRSRRASAPACSPPPTRPGTSDTSARCAGSPCPSGTASDRTYPLRGEHPADYFYEVPDGARRWIASLDADGHGLVQTSTDTLRGRKLFLWGSGRGGRRWQEWLTEPGTAGYAEIQAGLPAPSWSMCRWRQAPSSPGWRRTVR